MAGQTKQLISVALIWLTGSVWSAEAQGNLTVSDAVSLAIANDPWLQGSRFKQSAAENRSVAAGTLPDPAISISMMNLPTDSFSLGQENMTQTQIGLSQTFPRGNSQELSQQKLALQAAMGPHQQANRRAMVERDVTLLWLDAYLATQSRQLIDDNKVLFEQIREIAQSTYASASGQTRQKDIIRAELELIQFEDRATIEAQKLETAQALLSEWLMPYQSSSLSLSVSDMPFNAISVATQLPSLTLRSQFTPDELMSNTDTLLSHLGRHPTVQAIELQYQASQKDVALAEQQYKPQWKVSASYGWRDDTPSGDARADLFSFGVTMDVPLFSRTRQDKSYKATVYDSQAVKTQKLLTLKSLLTGIHSQVRQLQRIEQRELLYETKILHQVAAQAEASMTAYMNDSSDFTQVVQARIAELEAKLAALSINVEKQKQIARLNYFLTQSDSRQVKSAGAGL